MRIWIDAQLSPAIAAWINRTFKDIKAESIRAVGLRDALDREIFDKARQEDVIIMSKDNDFIKLIDQFGPPPKLIWITCGNTSNAKMREILSKTLNKAKELFEKGENIIEISDK